MKIAFGVSRRKAAGAALGDVEGAHLRALVAPEALESLSPAPGAEALVLPRATSISPPGNGWN